MRRVLFFFMFLFSLPSVLNLYGDEFLDKSYAQEFFKQGVIHYNHQEYEAAVEYLRKSLGKAPDDMNTRFFLGMSYYRAGFEENALFEFNAIIENEQSDITLKNLVSQLVNFMNVKKAAAQQRKKSDDYTLNLELNGNPIGKYYLTKVTGIDVDGTGNIYAAGFGSKIALKLSPEGAPLQQYVDPKVTPGRLYDIVVNSSGDVYISDFTNDTVYMFANNGKYIGNIGASGFEEGQFFGPTSLALDRDDDLYVIDSGNMRIQKFTPDGEFLLAFGKKGSADGDFGHPAGIAVDFRGRIFISDNGKKKIGVYDRSGNFITYLEGGDLEDPFGISFAETNRLVVSDRKSIKTYDVLHSSWTQIDTDDRLSRVLDAKIDHLGQIIACDYDRDTLLQFVPKEDKYRNLNVILNRVDAGSFPAIVYYISVFDADGLPFYGLGHDNFRLKVGGGSVQKIDLSYNEVRDSRLDILFLVDKSASMEEHAPAVEETVGTLLDKTSLEDEMAVIAFHNKNWIASTFTHSKLKTLSAIMEDRYDTGKKLDEALRHSIDYLNKAFYKKALVVITDGRVYDSSFSTYSMQSCINYAANNNIPVFFLNFGEAQNSSLEYFARSTGGKVYDVYRSNEIPFLYDRIRSTRSPEYIVFFNDVYNKALHNLYVSSEADVEINKRFGKSRLGFIYP